MRFTWIRSSFALAFAVTFSALLFASSAQAADPLAAISGTILNDQGAPAAGIMVRLEQFIPADAGRGGGGGPGGTKVVARGKTDQQGKFSWKDLPPGDYTLIAGSQNVGWVYMTVTLQAGKDLKLDDLKLSKTN